MFSYVVQMVLDHKFYFQDGSLANAFTGGKFGVVLFFFLNVLLQFLGLHVYAHLYQDSF